MNLENTIAQELQELGCKHLPAIGNRMPFVVPEGYFEQLQQSIPFWIGDAETTPRFGKILSPQFSIPVNYFEQNLLNTVAAVRDEPSFALPEPSRTVPEGYFESFPMAMLAKAKAATAVQEQVNTKVVDFRPVYPARRTLRLAAAAIAFLLLGFGAMKLMPLGDSNETTLSLTNQNAGGSQLALDSQSAYSNGKTEPMVASGNKSALSVAVQAINMEKLSEEEIFEFLTGDEDQSL